MQNQDVLTKPFFLLLLTLLALLSISGITWASSTDCNNDNALSDCIQANKSPDYYIEQSVLYFMTMESSVSPSVQPNYAEHVIRWEWPPWLLLTGYGSWNLIWTDTLLKLWPTSYQKIDCRFFNKQPFGRCHVVFNYSGHLCPIYEEFTFNSEGDITFIEAWTDHEDMNPTSPSDPWAEHPDVHRLSSKVPGLGSPVFKQGIAPGHKALEKTEDEDLISLGKRIRSPYYYYFKALFSEDTDIVNGCEAKSMTENGQAKP